MDSGTVSCTYCLHTVTTTFVKCTECLGVNLCITCFSSGVEAGCHKKTHGYQIKSAQSSLVPVFGNWNATEEFELLDALEHYGIGNWEDVSSKVASRTPVECMYHYSDYYLNGLLSRVWSPDCQSPRVTDHTAQSHTSPSMLHSSPGVYIEVEDQQLLGYMPARGDFERDYDNDAESILCRLHPSFSHDDLEDALKVAQVGIYMQRLRERQRRKEIAREHGLIAQILAFILNKRLRRRTPDDKRRCLLTGIRERRRGRPPLSSRKSLYSDKLHTQRCTPFKRISLESSSFCDDTKPPPGSWLAAPFILKASGATRGTPLVASAIPSNTNESRSINRGNSSHVKRLNYISNTIGKGSPMTAENRTTFCLNEKLKPFLRYFSGQQGKHFMDNLYREEVLKHEIKHLLDYRLSGKNRLTGNTLKIPPLKSAVYCSPPKSFASLGYRRAHPMSAITKNRRRRRHGATPWYIRAQRKVRYTS